MEKGGSEGAFEPLLSVLPVFFPHKEYDEKKSQPQRTLSDQELPSARSMRLLEAGSGHTHDKLS